MRSTKVLRKRMVGGAVAFAVAAGLLTGGLLSASASGDASMLFGRPTQGNECDFPCTDNASFHAKDRIVPGAIGITTGTTVNFDVAGFHQVAIYEVGVKPQDIEPNGATFPFVNDSDDRIFLGAPLTDANYQFTEAGKYLVICNVTPHFEEAQMWGWVNVR